MLKYLVKNVTPRNSGTSFCIKAKSPDLASIARECLFFSEDLGIIVRGDMNDFLSEKSLTISANTQHYQVLKGTKVCGVYEVTTTDDLEPEAVVDNSSITLTGVVH
jgi:hypothetical protein